VKVKKTEKKALINVDIAPDNWLRLNTFIEDYNEKPDRSTPKLKYVDVINMALDEFLNDVE